MFFFGILCTFVKWSVIISKNIINIINMYTAGFKRFDFSLLREDIITI